MWIALSIIAFFTLVFKKKSKKSKQAKMLALGFLIVVASIGISNAQTTNCCIRGKVILPKASGQLYIYLVDKNQFEIPFSGIDTIIYQVNRCEYNFTFQNVKHGEYSIRCYQDLNNNQKLDSRFFKPIEPWGFSWNNKKKFPFDFEDVSFHVKEDIYVNILLDK